MAQISLVGTRFGRWLVLSEAQPKNHQGHKRTRWLCQCACGTERIVQENHLVSGKSTSCRCYNIEVTTRKKYPSTFRAIFVGYRDQAKKKNRVFELTDDQFYNLSQKNCFYCNASPSNTSKHQSKGVNYIYNGLDRVDNSLGYTLDNVVPCCKICNIAKRGMTIQEFTDWIARVYRHVFEVVKC